MHRTVCDEWGVAITTNPRPEKTFPFEPHSNDYAVCTHPTIAERIVNKITPFLWFNDNAEAAADFYLTVFPNSRKLRELRTTEAGPGPIGSLLLLDIELNGQPVILMNGGPGHPPTDAFSFSVECETQTEIDRYWSQLTANGGSEIMCGWLKDKFGLHWQIVPKDVYKYVSHPAGMRAMMAMKKMDIATLKQAASKS